VTRAYVPLVVTLSLLWGASYLFIKVGDREIEPATMMLARVLVAGVVLCGYLAVRGELGELRRAPVAAYTLGILNGALPFTLIAWGEKHVDSGVAAIANSTVPIFVTLLALRFRPSERATGLRLFGVLLGLLGVGVLAGVHPGGGWWGAAGTAAITLASVSYGVSILWGQTLIERTSGPVLATAAVIGAAIVLLPFGLVQAPHHVPSWKPVASVAALAFLGTAAAQLVWFRLLRGHGSARSSLVNYLLPPTALLYGVTLLGEPLTAEELIGLVLVLAGVALGSGAVRIVRRQPAPVTPGP
jgi:drug/metabolite transporter (DMT)-like permease